MKSFVLAALLALAVSVPTQAQVYKGITLVQPSLVADTTAIVPGGTFQVGLVLKMAGDWHTYWRYAGDAGIPTSIKWHLPGGFTAGPINWPIPAVSLEKEVDILTYIFNGEVMLTQTIHAPANLTPGATIELKADASWLVCEEICVPGKAALTLSLPVAASAQPANAARFAQWASRLPSGQPPPFPVSWTHEGKNLTGKITLPAGTTAVNFFPEPSADQLVNHPAVTGPDAGVFTIAIETTGDLPGVLTTTGADGAIQGWQITAKPSANAAATPVALPAPVAAPIATPTPVKASPAPPTPVAPPIPVRSTAASPTIWVALWFGFLGGLILNLMPCVLPVISLKIFGFVQQAGQSRRRIALHGISFSAGIFTWFLGLGVVIVVLKASGLQPTWAFQFQNPWFNLAIATLVFVFALNLFGVFELVLPGRASTKLSEAGGADGYAGSFFQGVFATLLATPCTGPFLGTALGFAFVQSAPVTLLLFASMSAGMSLPYLALAAQPGWVRFLPKPGVWMERLKQFMGFPLLATLLWLLYIIGAQRGATAIVWVGAFLLTLGLALWIYGGASGPGVKPLRRVIWQLVALIIVIAGGRLFLVDLFAAEGKPAVVVVTAHDPGPIKWIPYSKAKVDQLLAAGKPVFIDFTADWCLSCKYNERTSIDTPAVRQKIKDLGIAAVKADWTNANPEITSALQLFGRVGVPFYVLYPAGHPDEPITLPELLTESLVLDALSKAR